MSGMSDYTEELYLKHCFQNAAWPVFTNLYLALATTLFTDAGGGVEVSTSGTGYARKAYSEDWSMTFVGSPSYDVHCQNGAITWSVATANWGTVVGYGFFDASVAGNLIVHGPLDSNQSINTGNRMVVYSQEWIMVPG